MISDLVQATADAGVKADLIEANETQLYCEVRGRGPAVLFILGATGDAGHFADVASQLADQFTVVTFDRRGNSRSRCPVGWTTTTVAEQSDDAAALITLLNVPTTVVGSSIGAIIALDP